MADTDSRPERVLARTRLGLVDPCEAVGDSRGEDDRVGGDSWFVGGDSCDGRCTGGRDLPGWGPLTSGGCWLSWASC